MFVAAVSAAPEAGPQFAYAVGSSPLVYAEAPYPLVHHAVQYTVPATGCRNDAGAIVPCAGAVPFVAPIAAPFAVPVAAPAAVNEPAVDEPAVVVERKRREAEAEPEAAADADAEADPWLLYGGYGYAAPYAYHGYSGYSPYAYHGGYYGHYAHAYAHPYAHYSYFGRKKRDADATPEADADAYYGYPYAYGLGYGGYGYAAPYAYGYAAYGGCRNNYGGLVPCAGR